MNNQTTFLSDTLYVDKSKAAKFRKLAAGMQNQIDKKMGATVSGNWTERRASMAANQIQDGMYLQKIQAIINRIADGWEDGSIDPLLAGIKTKNDVITVLEWRSWPQSPEYKWHADVISILEKAGFTSKNYAEARIAFTDLIEVPDDRELKRREREDRIRRLVGQVPGFFPTPKEVVENMLLGYSTANLHKETRWLEPSAGAGHIADILRSQGRDVSVIECNGSLREILKEKGYNVVGSDFLEFSQNGWDHIAMNPPFENGQDIDHVRHAYSLLTKRGEMASVMSTGSFSRNDKKAVAFREWLEEVGYYKEDLGPGAFAESGTNVNACIVWIRK